MFDLIFDFIDPVTLIKSFGIVGIIFIIFAESGLFFGFFLPGDSLLLAAGLLASQGFLNIWALSLGSFIAAVLGDAVGYWFGRKIGPKIFIKEDSIFFHKKHVHRAKIFYEKYGSKTIILARFIPIIRTFAPILAGVGQMRYKKFALYNVIGGFIWAIGASWAGYILGNYVPDIEHYILPIIFIIIIISFWPMFREFYIQRKASRETLRQENQSNK